MRAPAVLQRAPTHVRPQECIEAATFLDRGECGAGVVAHRGDLETVADQSGVAQQQFDAAIGQARATRDIETGECAAIVLALVEYGTPGQSRLRAFEAEELEQRAVVVQRHAPFVVVVLTQAVAA